MKTIETKLASLEQQIAALTEQINHLLEQATEQPEAGATLCLKKAKKTAMNQHQAMPTAKLVGINRHRALFSKTA